ncbi:MAG: hypothetical protein WKG00_02875 [Polyangiaceae bacterium]
MRLQAEVLLYLPAEGVLRSESLWDRVKTAFGAHVDLASPRARVLLEATAVVEQSRQAMKRLGVDNAVSLVIDDTVIFSDTVGRPNDLGDLMLAMSEHAPVYGQGFRAIRFATEHEEGGLRYIIEVHCLAEHDKDAPAARVYLGGRVRELEARSGESGDAYQARVAPQIAKEGFLDGQRRQFEAFSARLADALRATFPEGRVEEVAAEAKVVRPAAPGAESKRPEPGHAAYDPYAHYYPSPFEPMLSGLMLGMFMSHMFAPPFIHVVHPSGAHIAPADQLDGHGGELAPEAADPGDADSADGGDLGGDGDGGGDFGGGDGDAGGDGDFGGGDFGGGDFGGGDF